MEITTIRRLSEGHKEKATLVPSLRVLVVEDDADTADSLAILLRLEGHDVRLARNGPAALALAGTCKPDMVLLDIGLPGMDGYEVANRLKAMKGGEALFIIAITGYGQASDRRRSTEAGIDLHMVKPADPNVLLRVLMRFREVAK
jgi:CheY-like chemotaxis protein